MSAIVLQVEYQVGGGSAEPTLTRLTTALERAGAEVADVGKHILPRLVPVLEQGVAAQFDAEGAGPTGAWAQLSPPYARWKEANFPGQPILVRTGALRAALTEGGAPGALRDVSSDSLAFGTAGVPYASYHQTGTGRMPSRPPFDFGAELEEGIQQAATAGVRAAVREASDGLLDFEGDVFEGQQVFTGARGGRYINTAGGRTYLKRDRAGNVVRQRRGR